MENRWQKVPINEAVQHPLYGVGGWLIVFSISLALGLLKEIGAISAEAQSAGMSLSEFFSVDHPAISYIKLALGLQTLIVAVIFWLLLSKHPSFRNTASALLLIGWPVTASIGLLNQFPGLGNGLGQSLIPWAVSCAVWVTYLQRSKRVRVTFENSITAETKLKNSKVSLDQQATTQAAVDGATLQNAHTNHLPASQVNLTLNHPSEEFWATALAEFQSNTRRPGLWARVFSEANGDESVAKAAYLSYRATELQAEHASKAEAAEREQRKRAREIHLANLSDEERAYEKLPKGECPNCDSIIPITSLVCPKCKAMFGEGSAWQITPLESNGGFK